MTAPPVDRVTEVLGDGVGCTSAYDVVTVDVPRERWVEAVTAVRDDEVLDLVCFDLLTAVDELADGFDVVLRLWSPARRHGLVLRTRCPRDDARVPSLTGVFGGAAWHERATAELFGIGFDGHPGLVPLLLADGAGPAPLRKDVLLAARVETRWPGAKEPGESDADLAQEQSRPRRRHVPPGVVPVWDGP